MTDNDNDFDENGIPYEDEHGNLLGIKPLEDFLSTTSLEHLRGEYRELHVDKEDLEKALKRKNEEIEELKTSQQEYDSLKGAYSDLKLERDSSNVTTINNLRQTNTELQGNVQKLEGDNNIYRAADEEREREFAEARKPSWKKRIAYVGVTAGLVVAALLMKDCYGDKNIDNSRSEVPAVVDVEDCSDLEKKLRTCNEKLSKCQKDYGQCKTDRDLYKTEWETCEDELKEWPGKCPKPVQICPSVPAVKECSTLPSVMTDYQNMPRRLKK